MVGREPGFERALGAAAEREADRFAGEIGDMLGLTVSRVSQIRTAAIKHLRASLQPAA